MANKICTKCKSNKPLVEFYRNARTFDGHLQRCKECSKEIDSNRRNNDETRKAAREHYQKRISTQEGRQKRVDETRRWNEKHRIKSAAQTLVHNAIAMGKLVRQTVCVRCNLTGNLDAHHEDYSKPLEITWLCKRCHGLRHRELNKQRNEARRG